jgi:polysaccharide pyruvyl transferase WcaK-like protein
MLPPLKEDKKIPQRRLKVGLLGASFETQNFGVAALLCGAVASICDACPDARIFIVDYAKRPTTYQVAYHKGSARVDLINIRFSKRFYLKNNIGRLLATAALIRLLPSRGLRKRFIKQFDVLKTVYEADLVGAIAGGDSFSDIYGNWRLIYVTLPQILALLLDKPLILLPQTLGPFKTPFSRMLARQIIRHTQKVYSRDYEGLTALQNVMRANRGRVEFCYDMGFVMEPQIAEERIPVWLSRLEPDSTLIGLNVSGLLYMGGYSQKNMFGLQVDYRNLVHELADYFIRKHSAHIMLVPHVFGLEENSESDVIACFRIYSDAPPAVREHLHLLEDQYNQHELKALIGKCDFFLGSRMHACIGALSQCIPALGLSYSKKFFGVFETIGMESLVIDLRAQNHCSIADTVGKLFERREELRNQLQEKIPEVRKAVLDLFTRIREEWPEKSLITTLQ